MDLASNIAAYITNPENAEQIATDFADYYEGRSSTPNGARFDDLCRHANPVRFDDTDFEAVAAIGPPLGAEAMRGLREEHADAMAVLLAELDEQVRFMPIWDAPEDVWSYPDAPLPRAFMYLRDQVSGIGGIFASKLLACKYPELVPVRDIVTERVVGTDHTGPWGLMMRAALDETARETLTMLSGVIVPEYVTMLRRLGVALWMAGSRADGGEILADGTIGDAATS